MQFADYKDMLAKGRVADAVLVCVLVRTLYQSHDLAHRNPGRLARTPCHGILEAGVPYPLRETHGDQYSGLCEDGEGGAVWREEGLWHWSW